MPPKNRATPINRRSGFSLTEIVVAMMVLALGLGGAIIALRVGFGVVETARDQTAVSQFLQSEIETLRLHNWRELTALPQEERFMIEVEGKERYQITRIIEEVRPNAQIRRVILRANWRTSNGVERELLYKTRISREGLNDYYYRSL